jgi:hypothetical protein
LADRDTARCDGARQQYDHLVRNDFGCLPSRVNRAIQGCLRNSDGSDGGVAIGDLLVDRPRRPEVVEHGVRAHEKFPEFARLSIDGDLLDVRHIRRVVCSDAIVQAPALGFAAMIATLAD